MYRESEGFNCWTSKINKQGKAHAKSLNKTSKQTKIPLPESLVLIHLHGVPLLEYVRVLQHDPKIWTWDH